MKTLPLVAAVLLMLCNLAQAEGQIPDHALGMTALQAKSLSPAKAQELEEGLKANPDDFTARVTLLGYYFRAPDRNAHLAEFASHALWVVKNHPDSEFAGMPYAQIDQITDPQDYATEKSLWLEQIKSHPDNTAIVGNAANLFERTEPQLAEDLLKKAAQIDKLSPKWHDALGNLYELRSHQDPAYAARALAEFEAAQSLDRDKFSQFYRMSNLAKTAYGSGDMDKAARYANLALETATANPKSFIYGDAIHQGNIVLGRIALKQGNIALAKSYLLKAGNTPGSPELNTFGPNMSLARDLVLTGDMETPLQYFELCRKFWKMGDKQLDAWEVAVKDGKTPEFGANLVY